ncbi:MAG: hypothetical protein DCC75_05615 [Proteobacteria bacterium]|nr:MAG: hypothetical protein DCC75_05615 [Pseudomonadota bacterium]
MKRQMYFLYALMMCLIPAAVSYAAVDENAAYVKVKNTKLRSSPQLFAPVLSDLKYGDKLTTLETSGSWYKAIDSRGRQGYVHTSAITDREVVLQASNRDFSTAADTSDVVLAGKGFNKEVEKEYAAANANLDFKAVNEMEKYKVTDSELRSFVKSGKLNAEG